MTATNDGEKLWDTVCERTWRGESNFLFRLRINSDSTRLGPKKLENGELARAFG